MNILCSVCIYFLLLIFVDATALKLIPGDHSVVKKDGVTHTISKYYVVPNDFDVNQDTNNNNRYTKNMDQDIVREEHYRLGNDQLEEYRSMGQDIVSRSDNDQLEEHKSLDQEVASEDHYLSDDGQLEGYKVTVNNNGANLLGDTGLNEVQASAITQSDGNAANAWVSMETQQGTGLESASLGNLLVEPILYNNTNNISNENNLHYISEETNDSAFDIRTKKQINVEFDAQQSILTDFAFVVIESSNLNLDSFWAVFNNYVKAISDKDEQLIRIENLFVLLNVFTSLYRATQLHIPIDGMIDDIVNVLQMADIKNTDSNKDGSKLKPTQNSNTKPKRECLTKCLQKPSKANLDSKGVSISETDGRKAGDDLQNVKLDTLLQRRDNNADNVNVWVKFPPSSSGSNKPIHTKVNGIDKPVTIQRSLLTNPNYLGKLKGKPDGYNVRSTMAMQNQNQVARENGVYEDTKLNLNILDTAETGKLPYRIEDKNIKYWFREDQVDDDLPWHIEDKMTNNLPWHIEDKAINNQPYTIENKIGNVPVGLYPSDDSGIAVSDDNILLDSNQTPLTSTVNGVTVKNRFGKPYLYTYVINPTKFLYRVPDISSNIVKIKSGKYNNNFEAESENVYDISNTYGQETNSKVVFINAPSSGHYESELSLSEEPRFVYSNEPGYYGAQLKIEKDIELSSSNGDNNNPLIYLPNTAPNHYEPEITVEIDKEINIDNNPAFLLPNSPSYDSIVKLELEKDYGVPITQEIDADFEIMLPNVPSTPYESKLSIIEKDETSAPLIDDTKPYINNVRPFSAPLNYYESDLNIDQQNGNNPMIPFHGHINIEKEYKIPTSGYGGEIDINSEIIVPYQPIGHTMPFLKKPSVTYLHGNQPGYDYVDGLKAKLAPSYQLFATENLLKLHEALIKTNQVNVYEDTALTNLKNINIILLKLAEYLGGNGLSNKWYENIFYNARNPRHPLQMYVYNLLRQKWLHEIMLSLYNNNFNLNILNNPRLYSFLTAWRFPTHVLKFLEPEEILQNTYNTPNIFEETFGAQNVVHENIGILEQELETQEVLENFETEAIVDDYKTENEGVILSITGFKVGLDANAIVDILKKYLLYKNYVETQEHIINRGNKIEMFKQIASFLNEKGYGGRTIVELIRKLYGTVYSVEEGGCKHTKTNDFVQNAYNVIIPVLRRSGQ